MFSTVFYSIEYFSAILSSRTFLMPTRRQCLKPAASDMPLQLYHFYSDRGTCQSYFRCFIKHRKNFATCFKLALSVGHLVPIHNLPSRASCASIDALSPLRIRSNSGGQVPVTNSRSSSGTPASASTNRQVACASKWCAFSPVAAYRVRKSFSRRTLFSIYESNWFMALFYHNFAAVWSCNSFRFPPDIQARFRYNTSPWKAQSQQTDTMPISPNSNSGYAE